MSVNAQFKKKKRINYWLFGRIHLHSEPYGVFLHSDFTSIGKTAVHFFLNSSLGFKHITIKNSLFSLKIMLFLFKAM